MPQPPSVVPLESWLDTFALPLMRDTEDRHVCADPPCDDFRVRNKYYVTKGHERKGKKERSAPSAFRLVRVYLVPAKAKIDHLLCDALNPSAARFMLGIVFQVNVKDFVQHIVFLFEREAANDATLDPADLATFSTLLDQCAEPDTQLFANRLKILPLLSAGAGAIMRGVVNNQPGQLAEALECKQYGGHKYVEVDVDIDAYKSDSVFTKLAKAAVGLVYPKVAHLTVDLAFMIAGLSEAELPERLLGAARLHRLNLHCQDNMIGTTAPGRKVLMQPTMSDMVREIRRSMGETALQMADMLEGPADDDDADPGSLPATSTKSVASTPRTPRTPRGTAAGPERSRKRVKKRGVARQFQRFGHWVYSDHPDYKYAYEAVPAGASPPAMPAGASLPPSAKVLASPALPDGAADRSPFATYCACLGKCASTMRKENPPAVL